MTKKKNNLLNENVIRRWGKLADMPALTENWLDTITEADADEEESEAAHDEHKAEDEMDYAEGDLERADDDGMDMDMDGGGEVDPNVAKIVATAVVDALNKAAGEEVIDLEMDDDLDGEEMEVEIEADAPGMGMAYNREEAIDEEASETWGKGGGEYKRRRVDGVEKRAGDIDHHYKDYMPKNKKSKKKAGNRQDEDLGVEMIDDEALTEAVLTRVIERLLSNK